MISGIVLAGGASARMGRPKGLLEYHGVPFLRAVATALLTGGVGELVAVLNPEVPGLPDALYSKLTFVKRIPTSDASGTASRSLSTTSPRSLSASRTACPLGGLPPSRLKTDGSAIRTLISLK